jgi:hypothetical protein
MHTTTFRKSTLALALGAVIAATAFNVSPVLAQASGGDTRQDEQEERQLNNARAFTSTTTYYSAPAYVPVPAPAPATTYTTVSPNGTTTTTTYGGPSVAYVPAPAVSSTTVVTQRPCNPWDVPRPGVTTACPY